MPCIRVSRVRASAILSLRNYERLTNREVFWIANILFVRFKDRFPTFRRFIKLSRNRERACRPIAQHKFGLLSLIRLSWRRFLNFSNAVRDAGALFQLFVQR